MGELIDREALKDAVKRYAGEPIKEKDRKCQAICLDMLGVIDSQPAASPWHRVEEPPKYTSRYVVWCGVNWYGEGMHGDFMTANYNTVSGRWSVDCDRAINGPLIGDILYWMPIEPPTGTERSET